MWLVNNRGIRGQELINLDHVSRIVVYDRKMTFFRETEVAHQVTFDSEASAKQEYSYLMEAIKRGDRAYSI